MALGFGLMPSEVDQIGTRDYDLLVRYWQAEPWGTWRDNLHAALIAAQARAPYLKKGAKNDLNDFMAIDPFERQRKAASGIIELLKAISTRKKRT